MKFKLRLEISCESLQALQSLADQLVLKAREGSKKTIDRLDVVTPNGDTVSINEGMLDLCSVATALLAAEYARNKKA